MNGGTVGDESLGGPDEVTTRIDISRKSWKPLASLLLANRNLQRCRCILLDGTRERPLWIGDAGKCDNSTAVAVPHIIAYFRSSRSTVIQISQKLTRHASRSVRDALAELKRSPFDAAVCVRTSDAQIAILLIATKTDRVTAVSLRAVKDAARLLANSINARDGSAPPQSHGWLLSPAVRAIAHDLQNMLVSGATLLRMDAKARTGSEQAQTSLALSDLQVVQRFFQMLVAAADTGVFSPVRTNARAILDSATDKVRATATAKNIRITLHSDTTEVVVDRTLCSALLEQLLRNAIESTPNELTVSIAARQMIAEEMLRFEVRDSGQGVSARVATNLFSPFAMTKRVRDGHFGLGLAIAHEIARLHDGQLSFVNHSDGGASFYFDIPMRM